MSDVEKFLYSIADAGRALNMSRSALYALMADGKLEWVNVGRRRLIQRAELERFAASLHKVA